MRTRYVTLPGNKGIDSENEVCNMAREQRYDSENEECNTARKQRYRL